MSGARPPLLLHTERLSLLLPGPSAAEQFARYFTVNREHLSPWEPPFPQGVFEASFWQRRLAQNQQEYLAGQSLRLALVPRESEDAPLLGLCNFTQFVRGAFHACTLGYSLAEEAQGHGFMTEALRAATTHLFQDLRLHRIMASYLPINERSGRLLRRVGFTVEGYARDYLFIAGAWRDHIMTSLTNPTPLVPDYVRTSVRA